MPIKPLLVKIFYLLQELVRKKRYGRLQKALADISLLAGSPADAQDHYTTAAELCRVSNDWVWTAAALQGIAHAKVCAIPAVILPAPRRVHFPRSRSGQCFSCFLQLSYPFLTDTASWAEDSWSKN